MPTYAYACQQCDHTFEVRQSFSDDALSTCPECSGTLRKLFNNVGIVFKGSGFYRTDSRSGSGSAEKKTASSDSSSSTSSASSSSGSSSSGASSSTASSGSSSSGSSSNGSSSAA
ncbi:FmdB family zinc ribbon protein [Kineococcus indalonis]|uniref:FmdB family zinc ribbon protein n=1 Tax=Kineococcus indalonis TaxID=2696566 RepID=UPI001412466A|nr:FmdB family zinc ribbon protein [Kineococcus indalonis]NAZ88255.1 FmdB family transcriptional regulator [Kineococcus indalonis]